MFLQARSNKLRTVSLPNVDLPLHLASLLQTVLLTTNISLFPDRTDPGLFRNKWALDPIILGCHHTRCLQMAYHKPKCLDHQVACLNQTQIRSSMSISWNKLAEWQINKDSKSPNSNRAIIICKTHLRETCRQVSCLTCLHTMPMAWSDPLTSRMDLQVKRGLLEWARPCRTCPIIPIILYLRCGRKPMPKSDKQIPMLPKRSSSGKPMRE